MSNQEAIKKLRVLKYKYLIKRGSSFDAALDMAIEALSEETSTIQEKHQLSEETPTNISTKSTNASTNISADRPRSIEPTITVDLESGIIPRSAIEKRPHDVTKRYEK